MAAKGERTSRSAVTMLWTRFLIPVLLTALVLAHELAWKGRFLPAQSPVSKVINLGLFFVVGPVMAWWGLTVSRGLLQRLAHSEAAIEEKSRLLEQRNNQLQTVLQASRAMAALLDLRQVADLVVLQVTSHTRFGRAALILGPDSSERYQLAGSRGLPGAYLTRFLEALHGPARASSPVEWCRLTRQPVVVENLSRDFRTAGLREIYALAALEGMIAVPLLVHERFGGVLTVYPEKGGPISTAEISLVCALAAEAAVSLENARLFTQKAGSRSRSVRALAAMQEVAAALGSGGRSLGALLELMADLTARLFTPARVRLRVARSGAAAPHLVERSSGTGSWEGQPVLEFPVRREGETYGVMEVALAAGTPALQADDRAILQALADLAASALVGASAVAEMRQAVTEVERAYMDTLEALVKALEMRDHETEGHSRRVVQYTLSLAQQMGLAESQMVPMIRGALIHDLGKIGIPDAILKKAGPLTEAEWAIMRQHPQIGYEMLKGIEFLREATSITLHHHERYDGSGYPMGLAGSQIPVGARIFAVADAYDAITSDRPYRKGRPHEHALAEIQAGAGSQFDPDVVEALLSLPAEELARIRSPGLEVTR